MTTSTKALSGADSTQRFLFEQDNIRGEWIRLGSSLDAALAAHDYPANVETLLIESILASILLASTLKFDGKLILQAQGAGPITLLAVEATHRRTFRAIARFDAVGAAASATNMQALLGNANLVITLAPEQGQRYQGMVPMERTTLSQCLEQYFETSEQLHTFLFFAVRGREAVGLILQKLPASSDVQHDEERWQHVVHLAQTLQADEALNHDNTTLLHRLFHQDQVTLYPEQVVQFECSCSEQRSRAVVHSLGQEEALHLLEEMPEIEITCEFCSRHYVFDRKAVLEMFNLPPAQ